MSVFLLSYNHENTQEQEAINKFSHRISYFW